MIELGHQTLKKNAKYFHLDYVREMFIIIRLLLLMTIKTSLNKLNVCVTGSETKGFILTHSCEEIMSLNRLKAYLSEVTNRISNSTHSCKKIVYRAIKLANEALQST